MTLTPAPTNNSGAKAEQASPRLAPVLKLDPDQANRQVCLLDSNNRLTPWIAGSGAVGAGLPATRVALDLSLRPVMLQPGTSQHGRSQHGTPHSGKSQTGALARSEGEPGQSLARFESAYEAPACLSIWLLRKRPEERFTQARRLAFWELGAAIISLEKTLDLPTPWQFGFWIPADCRVQGLWLLDLDWRVVRER